MGDAAGRVMLIFGGAGGIGGAIEQRHRLSGGQVMVADITPVAEAEGRAACLCDVSREADVAAAVALTARRHGRIDAMVHCVGVPGQGPLARTTLDQWSRIIDVNLTSAYLAARESYPFLKSSRGAAVFVASTSGLDGGTTATGPAYAASKAGMINLARYLAKEWAADGVRVNTIAPGPVLTPLMAGLPADRQAAYARAMLTGRLIDPEEIAWAADYLLSDHARSVTGAVLNVSGGLILD